MPDWWASSIGPTAPILGALLSAVIGGAITLLIVHKRKRLIFTIHKSEDLTFPLKQHHGLISFKFGLREVSNLNRASVRVKNTGNTTIKDVKFDLSIFGHHPFHISEISLRDIAMVRGIQSDWRAKNDPDSPVLQVSAHFLNSKEAFEVIIYFDGEVEQPDVYCRMEEVRVTVRQGEMGESAWQLMGDLATVLARAIIPFR